MPWDEATARYRRSPKGRQTTQEYDREYYHRVLKFDPVNKAKRKQQSENNYYKRYGLTKTEATEMKRRGCDLCGDRDGKMNIDHCHDTGRVRGVLCNPCNLMLGYIERGRKFGVKLDEYLGLETKHGSVG